MSTSKPTFRRDLFEIENARNLTRDELVATFVPTKGFWRLLSAKNHIVLGSRGSGKTALAKMVSHDHLSRLQDERAQQIVKSKAFIGMYVPTRLEWVGALKNKPWQTEREKEEFFQWRLNVSSCLAYLLTVRSCLESYVDDIGHRARIESELAAELADSWSDGKFKCDTIRSLQNYLEDIEHKKQQQIIRIRSRGGALINEDSVGGTFDMDLFSPLRRGITLASRVMDFPEDCTWLLCLDEAEFLELIHHRILNSLMRAYSGNLFFKITTMPYCHYTLGTNAGASLNVGHDFEYVYVDQDPILWAGTKGKEGLRFATTVFTKRALVSGNKYKGVTLADLLGPSKLLDPKRSDWTPGSRNMALLRRYASEDTKKRAERLKSNRSHFLDQIARKMHGAILLRQSVDRLRGRGELDVYSGETMAIRCSDMNPRRLIRIFNSFLLEAIWRRNEYGDIRSVAPIPAKEQTRILTAFSTSSLSRVQSEPDCGPELYSFLQALGIYMHKSLHEMPLTTDQISSLIIEPSIPDLYWNLVQRAVGLGLLFPNVNANNPDQMPERDGTFHFGYVLAPHFRILPRRGRARRLSKILENVQVEVPSVVKETVRPQQIEFIFSNDPKTEGE
ncbi:MAG TPA: hypothetical protein VF131_22945 [Blastocatellia bacterium]|nr:hypothetical protein [Blastocatellia bacterium]